MRKMVCVLLIMISFSSFALKLERVNFFKVTPEDENNIKLESGSRLYLSQLVNKQLKNSGLKTMSLRFECTTKDKSSLSQCKLMEMNHILEVK
jgi:hypothetical protein